MTSFNSSNGSSSNNSGSQAHVAEQTAQKRTSYITNAQGDAVGHNFNVPKSDFANFLGYKPASADELSGRAELKGDRVIEVALQKEFNQVGQGAADRSNNYLNMFVSGESFKDKPGREKDMIKDGIEAIKAGPDLNSSIHADKAKQSPVPGGSAMDQYFARMDKMQTKSHNDNVRYLEMQYKFQEMSKSEGVISNLMKTRHDCVSRVLRGGGQ